MGQHRPLPQNCAYSSRHNEIVIDTRPISALVALTEKSEIPRKSMGEDAKAPPAHSRRAETRA